MLRFDPAPAHFLCLHLIVEFIYLYLIALLQDRSEDSFKSFEREKLVTQRMLERDYKLSFDDRRLLLEKAKAAAKNITKKD